MKQTILYIESAIGDKDEIWGSAASLSGLLERLDYQKYTATLMVYYKNNSLDYLETLGVKVLCFARPSTERKDSAFKSRIRNTRIGEHLKQSSLNELRREVVHFFTKTFPAATRIYKIIKREQPQLIHCNNGLKINLSAVIAAKLAGKKCICHERGIFHLNPLEKFISRYVNLFICNSYAVRQHYLGEGVNEKTVRVVHNGVDLIKFSPRNQRRDQRRDPRIISIGRLIDWKGHHILIRAASQVLEKYPSARFVLVGSGSYETELRNLAERLGVTGAMVYTGYLKDVRDALDESDIFVHCSIKPEPFGRTIIEAMAMGRATIATNHGAAPEIITDNVDGILIPPDDPEVLAKNIIRLLENGELREQLGAAAREKIKEKFDINFYKTNIETIYEEIFST
jgi:glycosyltransferase involved in cell wall biosynthesis